MLSRLRTSPRLGSQFGSDDLLNYIGLHIIYTVATMLKRQKSNWAFGVTAVIPACNGHNMKKILTPVDLFGSEIESKIDPKIDLWVIN